MLLDVKIPPWLFWKGFIAQGAGKLLMSDHYDDEDNDHSGKVGDNFEDPQKILVSNWGSNQDTLSFLCIPSYCYNKYERYFPNIFDELCIS